MGKPGHVTGERPGSGKETAGLEEVDDASHKEQCTSTHTVLYATERWDLLTVWSGVESQLQMLPRQETLAMLVRSGLTGNSVSLAQKLCLLFILIGGLPAENIWIKLCSRKVYKLLVTPVFGNCKSLMRVDPW